MTIVTHTFGWTATAMSLTYKIPQIRHLYKIKKSDGLNSTSLYIQAASYIFLITHGTIIADLPIMVMGCISLLQSALLILLYWYCAAKEKKQIKEQSMTEEAEGSEGAGATEIPEV
jgi:uncharacterized protein with PQ loop repeat